MATLLQQTAPHLNDAWRKQYVDRLTAWFEVHRRDLPWRQTSDPYAIWISESMLQQTQVATVIDYYQRFMVRFPTVDDLAAADESDVLTMWAGLGYYRRARQLHAAARVVVQEHASQFPRDIDGLMNLPGIGRYTAGAIASIAHGLPAPIVEANTQRLYARLMAIEDDLQSPSSQQLLWSFAEWQLDGPQLNEPQLCEPQTKSSASKSSKTKTSTPKSTQSTVSKVREPRVSLTTSSARLSGTINQAAMELGSLICKPTSPQCLVCPISDLCATATHGLQHRIPRPKPPKSFTSLHHIALVIARHHKKACQWLLRRNPSGEWWTGLWDFPRIDVTELHLQPPAAPAPSRKRRDALDLDHATTLQIEATALEQLGLTVTLGDACENLNLSHGVTRYRIRVDCFQATVQAVPQDQDGDAWQWCDEPTLSSLPLTASAKKMINKLVKA